MCVILKVMHYCSQLTFFSSFDRLILGCIHMVICNITSGDMSIFKIENYTLRNFRMEFLYFK